MSFLLPRPFGFWALKTRSFPNGIAKVLPFFYSANFLQLFLQFFLNFFFSEFILIFEDYIYLLM